MEPTMLMLAIQFTVYAASPVPETSAFVMRVTTVQDCAEWKREKEAEPQPVLDKTNGRQIVYRGYACAITDDEELLGSINVAVQLAKRDAEKK